MRMKISQSKYDRDKTAKIFARLILQGKINAALRYLNENGNVGVLNLSPEVLLELKEKHPPPSKIQPYSLLFGPIDLVPNSVFDSIDETMIYKVAMVTNGAGGPSNFDAEQHHRILCSKNFSTVGKDLREQTALITKKLRTNNLDPRCLEALNASRVIPLDKNPCRCQTYRGRRGLEAHSWKVNIFGTKRRYPGSCRHTPNLCRL